MSKNDPESKEEVCPGCGKTDGVFKNGNITMTTDGIQLVPYWCNSCMHPFHVYKKNGKVVSRDEF